MTPRPRKASDEQIFAGVRRAMTRLSPGDLTLAEIANEVGVTAGALVQRFGSKRELMVAMTAGWAEGTADLFAELRAAHSSPLETIRGYARCMSGLASSPSVYARNLAYLLIDLTDDDLSEQLARQAMESRRELASLVRDAVRAGELKGGTDPDRLARIIETVINGSLMTWALHQGDEASSWLAADLDAALAPMIGGPNP